MATKYTEVAGTVLVGTVVAFALTTVGNIATASKGALAIGISVADSSGSITPITIQNYSSSPIDELRIVVPGSVTLADIRASHAVQIDLESSTSARRQIANLRSLSPQSTIHVLVHHSVQDNDVCCSAVNARDVGLDVVNEVVNPLRAAVLDALQLAVIFAVVYLMFAVWHQKEISSIKTDLDEARTAAKSHMEKLDALRDETHAAILEGKKRTVRMRLILFKRINDYAKELAFWRGTFRHLILHTGGDLGTSAQIVERVTDRLETYGTREFPLRDVKRVERWDDTVSGIEAAVRSELDGELATSEPTASIGE